MQVQTENIFIVPMIINGHIFLSYLYGYLYSTQISVLMFMGINIDDIGQIYKL